MINDRARIVGEERIVLKDCKCLSKLFHSSRLVFRAIEARACSRNWSKRRNVLYRINSRDLPLFMELVNDPKPWRRQGAADWQRPQAPAKFRSAIVWRYVRYIASFRKLTRTLFNCMPIRAWVIIKLRQSNGNVSFNVVNNVISTPISSRPALQIAIWCNYTYRLGAISTSANGNRLNLISPWFTIDSSVFFCSRHTFCTGRRLRRFDIYYAFQRF